jgi:hypothetical protein
LPEADGALITAVEATQLAARVSPELVRLDVDPGLPVAGATLGADERFQDGDRGFR